MRPLLQNLLMMLIAVFLSGSLAVPHVCFDDDSAVKVEHQVKIEKTASHDHSSKNGTDNCCVAHHCCFAKVITPAQSFLKIGFATKTDLTMPDPHRLVSIVVQGFDRPPKSFA